MGRDVRVLLITECQVVNLERMLLELEDQQIATIIVKISLDSGTSEVSTCKAEQIFFSEKVMKLNKQINKYLLNVSRI